MSRLCYNLVLATILVIISYIAPTSCFAEWMTKDFCDRPLEKGEVIMNNFVEESSARTVTLFRGAAELKSGDKFQPGEMLRVHLSDDTPQYVLEVKNGYFPGGGCKGRRIHGKNNVDVMMPLDEEAKNPVSIVAGWAPGHAKVGISTPFILNPEAVVASPDNLTLPVDEAAHGSNATASDIHTSAQIKIIDLNPVNGTHHAEKIDAIKVPKIDISSSVDSDKSGHQKDSVIHIDHHHHRDSAEDPNGHIQPPPPGLGQHEDSNGHFQPPPPGLGREELAEFMRHQHADPNGHFQPPPRGLGREELAEFMRHQHEDINGHIQPPPPGLGREELAEFMRHQHADPNGHIQPPPPGLGREELAEFMRHQHEDINGHIQPPPPGLGREELAEFMRHQHADPNGHIQPPPPGLGREELAEFMRHQHADPNGHIQPPPPGLGREELAEFMRHQIEDIKGHIRPLGLDHLAERMRRNDHQHHDLTSAHQPPTFKFDFQYHVHPTSPPAPAHDFVHPDMHNKDVGKGQGSASVFSHDSNPNRLAEILHKDNRSLQADTVQTNLRQAASANLTRSIKRSRDTKPVFADRLHAALPENSEKIHDLKGHLRQLKHVIRVRADETPLTLAAEVLLILAAVLLLFYGWKFRYRWLRVAARCGKSRVTAE